MHDVILFSRAPTPEVPDLRDFRPHYRTHDDGTVSLGARGWVNGRLLYLFTLGSLCSLSSDTLRECRENERILERTRGKEMQNQ